MRIGELARRSGVPVPTIKYYLRAGLLAPGLTTARNQAVYGAAHLRRLRLVRVFLEIGGLSVKATHQMLAAIDRSGELGPDLLAALGPVPPGARYPAADDRVRGTVLRQLAGVVAGHGWRTRSQDRALERLADICVAARLLELSEVCALTEAYADTAARLAECDLELVRRLVEQPGSSPSLPERVAAAIVLTDAMVAVLHDLAREATLARLVARASEPFSVTDRSGV